PTFPVSGLQPSTKYTIYIKTICSATDSSIWTDGTSFQTLCNYPDLIAAPSVTVCGSQEVDLTAIYSGGTVFWYDDAAGTNLIHTGANFTTPHLTSDTSYWVQAGDGQPIKSNLGKVGTDSNAGTGGGLTTYQIFTAHSDFVLESVDIFPFGTGPGTVEIELRTSTGTPIMSQVVNVTGTSSPTSPAQTAILNFPIQGGSDYRLGVKSWTGGVTNLYRDNGTFPYPYTDSQNLASLTSTSGGTIYYYFFYNWQLNGGSCSSAMHEVKVTVDPKPAFELSSSTATSCEGGVSATPVTITTNLGGYDTFVWTPSAGVTGDAVNGWT